MPPPLMAISLALFVATIAPLVIADDCSGLFFRQYAEFDTDSSLRVKWVEIFNSGDSAAPQDGCVLSITFNGAGDPVVIPIQAKVAPGTSYIVCNQFSGDPPPCCDKYDKNLNFNGDDLLELFPLDSTTAVDKAGGRSVGPNGSWKNSHVTRVSAFDENPTIVEYSNTIPVKSNGQVCGDNQVDPDASVPITSLHNNFTYPLVPDDFAQLRVALPAKVEGIVTADVRTNNKLNGLFIQGFDEVPGRVYSNAILLDGTLLANRTFTEGQRIVVDGASLCARDRYTRMLCITETSQVEEIPCSANVELAPHFNACMQLEIVALELPMPSLTAWYRNQYMLSRVTHDLVVNDVLTKFSWYQEVGLYKGGIREQATQNNVFASPREYADFVNLQERSTLTLQNPISAPRYSAYLPSGFIDTVGKDRHALRAGAVVRKEALDVAGVVTRMGGNWGILPSKAGLAVVRAELHSAPTDADARFDASFPPNSLAGEVPVVKVAGMNLYNFFATLKQRGAKNEGQFQVQKDKLSTVMQEIDAAIIGVQELENHPTDLAARLLVGAVNTKAGTVDKYDYVKTGVIGTDVIKCGILYQPDLVEPVGAAAVLEYPEADNQYALQRPSVAQTFRVHNSDQHITVVSVHFKSKRDGFFNGTADVTCPVCDDIDPEHPCALENNGGCDEGFGGGFFSAARARAAERLKTWIAGNPTGEQPNDRYIVVGDLNSYRMEPPLEALRKDGAFVDLIHRDNGDKAYSYSYASAFGTLDYLLASKELGPLCGVDAELDAKEWTINSRSMDIGSYLGMGNSSSVFRASDHDPSVVACQLGEKVINTPVGTAPGPKELSVTTLALAAVGGVVGLLLIGAAATVVLKRQRLAKHGSKQTTWITQREIASVKLQKDNPVFERQVSTESLASSEDQGNDSLFYEV